MVNGSDCPSTQSYHATNRPSYQCQQLKDLYTFIYITFSQPDLTKLYNENIGGHRYTFTLSDRCSAVSAAARVRDDAVQLARTCAGWRRKCRRTTSTAHSTTRCRTCVKWFLYRLDATTSSTWTTSAKCYATRLNWYCTRCHCHQCDSFTTSRKH